jgi:hypothetical protein
MARPTLKGGCGHALSVEKEERLQTWSVSCFMQHVCGILTPGLMKSDKKGYETFRNNKIYQMIDELQGGKHSEFLEIFERIGVEFDRSQRATPRRNSPASARRL